MRAKRNKVHSLGSQTCTSGEKRSTTSINRFRTSFVRRVGWTNGEGGGNRLGEFFTSGVVIQLCRGYLVVVF